MFFFISFLNSWLLENIWFNYETLFPLLMAWLILFCVACSIHGCVDVLRKQFREVLCTRDWVFVDCVGWFSGLWKCNCSLRSLANIHTDTDTHTWEWRMFSNRVMCIIQLISNIAFFCFILLSWIMKDTRFFLLFMLAHFCYHCFTQSFAFSLVYF